MYSTQNVSLPFSFSPDQDWNGNAGSWSTFTLRVGTPPQDFSVLPSTSGHQPWIPVPAGCTSTDPPDCGSRRGAQPFHGSASNGFLSNQSSTWEENGLFNLAIETHLGFDANGDYGYDTIGLEVENSGGPTLPHQVVAGIATKDFYVGQFGLDTRPSNFNTVQDPVPGYLKTLVTSNLIPSLAYGYTAGAKYRLDGVFGSLILGGYDASRFISSNINIPFGNIDSRILTVGVQSISVSDSLLGSVQPLPRGEFFLIDSSVPDLWLPEPTCRIFEQAFGLIYDNNTDLFLVNDSIHSRLMQLNPSITIKIGIQDFDGSTVDINLPYGAFDLQASSPIYSNSTNYFPIRRGANNTQYTLGRTFLQEAYIVVDYERSNFSVNQAVFRYPNPETIMTIHSTHTSSNATAYDHRLDHGAIAGIIVGPVAFLSIIITITVVLVRRRNRAKRNILLPSDLRDNGIQDRSPLQSSAFWIPELDPKIEALRTPQEVSATSRPRYELRDSSIASELPNPMLS